LGDVKVSPGKCHCVVVVHIVGAQPALKVDLCLRRQQQQECELTRQCYTATLDEPADNQPCQLTTSAHVSNLRSFTWVNRCQASVEHYLACHLLVVGLLAVEDMVGTKNRERCQDYIKTPPSFSHELTI
jgi:hypothetical protein